LSLITEEDVSMQLQIGIEPFTKFQPLGMIPRIEVLIALYVVWIHAFFVAHSTYYPLRNTKMRGNASRTNTKMPLYYLNNVYLFSNILLRQMLRSNTAARK
jgi:hypothetical protein